MNDMIWVAPVYIGCIVKVPFHVRSFSQVNLTATAQTCLASWRISYGHTYLPPNC